MGALLLGACGDDAVDSGGAAAAGVAAGAGTPAVQGGSSEVSGSPYGFEVWYDDYPGSPDRPHLSPRRPQETYVRTRAQSVAAVLHKLGGDASHKGWQFAGAVFGRSSDDETAAALARELDAALATPSRSDQAENLLKAMGRTGNPVCAPSVLRALEHSQRAVREAAMRALIEVGDEESVLQAFRWFETVHGRGLLGWIEAAVRHVRDEKLPAALRPVITDERFVPLWPLLLEKVVVRDLDVAYEVVQPWIGKETPKLHATIAVLRFLGGDLGGAVELRQMLGHEAPQFRALALVALQLGAASDFRNEVLHATIDPNADVRFAATQTCALLDGEDVVAAVEARTVDESTEVRREALAVLRSHGHVAPLEELCEVVRRASGGRLAEALDDLIAARYPGAVAAIGDRLETAETVAERRSLLRAAALTLTAESFIPLRDAFVAEDADSRSMRQFLAYLMANCRGAEFAVLELFDAQDAEDYRERGWLLHTLGNIAGDREDEEIDAAIYGRLREILFDAEEIPQMRLTALEYLRRDLSFDDVVPLRGLAAESGPQMRAALSDFLFEFF